MPYPQALGLAPPKVRDRACGSDGGPIGSRLLQNEEGADAREENQRLLPEVREGLLKEGCERGHSGWGTPPEGPPLGPGNECQRLEA